LNEKVGYSFAGNSGAARMIPKRPWPPQKQNWSNLCWYFVSIFSC